MACEVTWNPLDKHTSYTLSNSDLTSTKVGSSHGLVRSTLAKSTGKLYFEFLISTGVASMYMGVATASAALASYLGSDAHGWCLRPDKYKMHSGGSTLTDTGYTTSDVFQVAIDLDSGKVWFGVNGSWADSGDPCAGTAPTYTDSDLSSHPIFPTGSCYNSGGVFILRACDCDQSYSPPSGFDPWVITTVYKLSGTIKEKGFAAERVVKCYTRSTGILYSSTTSAPDGSFSLDAPDDSTEMYVIAISDDADGDFNSLIFDRVTGILQE